MSFPQDTSLVPSIQDQLSPTRTGGFGFADEPVQDPDSFPPEPEYTPEEEAEMQAQYEARLEDDRRAAECVAAFKPFADAAARFHASLHATGVTEGEPVDFAALSLTQLRGVIASHFTRGDDYGEAVTAGARAELARRSRPVGYRPAACLDYTEVCICQTCYRDRADDI